MELINFICARCYGSFLREPLNECLDDAKRVEYSEEEKLGIICEECHKEIAQLKVDGLWEYKHPRT